MMQMRTVVKIFSTHTVGKTSYVVQNDIIQPIRNNASLDKVHDIPGDNTGENISSRGTSYCELCTQYWAWKNVDADYYGFCHYRRYFSFADVKLETDDWSVVLRNYLNDEAVKELRLNDTAHIESEITKYDAIAATPVNLKKINIKSVYEQYKTGVKLHIEDLDLMMSIIERISPEMYPTAKRYMSGTTMYLCNMFIMRKELLQQYSTWLFNVLSEFDRLSDMSLYSVEGYRTPGHLGERLFGIFFTYLKEQGRYKLDERQYVFFKHPELLIPPSPFFKQNNIPIIMSANEQFAPYSAAAILSMLDCSNTVNNYDIIMLVSNMGDIVKKRLLSVIKGADNFSLRFFDVGSIFSKYTLFERTNISVETYFRLVIPEYFSAYDKVLYLDGDIIIKSDVAELFHTDIGNNLIAGVVDVSNAGVVNGFDAEGRQYNLKKLQLKDVFSQINAGILIINNHEFRKTFTTKYLLNFVQAGSFRFQDQDALNILCEGRIHYLDPAWNFFADPVESYKGWVSTFAPRTIYTAYREAAKNPKILHYAGNEKPWWFPGVEWADDFWSVFMRTPFYNSFIRQRMSDVSWDVTREISGNAHFGRKPSIFRRALMCYREHGPRYTFRRILVKLRLEKDPYEARESQK
jgi:lipopolysaccharide biosynthesis glycosyltransferase